MDKKRFIVEVDFDPQSGGIQYREDMLLSTIERVLKTRLPYTIVKVSVEPKPEQLN